MSNELAAVEIRKVSFEEACTKLNQINFDKILDKLRREYYCDDFYDCEDRLEAWLVRTIESFKAFLALADIADFSLVPSEDIDSVWHLCLEDKEFYENTLCIPIFGRVLRHNPSDGIPETETLLKQNFEKTAYLFKEKTGRDYTHKQGSCCAL